MQATERETSHPHPMQRLSPRLLPAHLLVLSLVLNLLHPTQARAVETPGALYIWGDGTSGQTIPPAGLGKLLGISAGLAHSLALLPDHSVVSWGTGAPDAPSLPYITDIAAGSYHSVALGSNGLVYSWGGDDRLRTPADVVGMVAIATGEQHIIALRAGGTVRAWGDNSVQQLVIPNGLSGVKAIAAGENHNLALLVDGRVACWGLNQSGQAPLLPNLGGRAVAIAAGRSHSVALLENGRVVVWGDNGSGQRNVPANLGVVTRIAAAGDYVLVVQADRTVRGWGQTDSPAFKVPGSLANAFRISAGYAHAMALRVDPPAITVQPATSSVLINNSITLTVGATGSAPLNYQWRIGGTNIANANASSYTIDSAQATNAGTYSVFIENGAGSILSGNAVLTVRIPPVITKQPADATIGEHKNTTFQVAASGVNLSFRWRFNGTQIPFSVLPFYTTPLVTLNDAGGYDVVITNIFGAVTSRVATLTVKPAPVVTVQPGSVESFPGLPASFAVQGINVTGYQWFKDDQPIDQATSSTLTLNPVNAADQGSYFVRLSNPWGDTDSDKATLTVSPADSFSELFGWGESQVWNGVEFINVLPPPGLSGIQTFAVGRLHGLALRSNGSLIGWGDNTHSELTIPPNLTGITALAAGDGFSLALLSDGTVMGWGRKDANQSKVPVSLSQVTAISAGFTHSLALKEDGTVVGWGSTSDGESAVPPGLGKVQAIAAGRDFNLVVLENGTVTGWGRNEFGQRRPPTGLSNVVAVAAGRAHGLALLGDGSIRAWGDNSLQQTQVPKLPVKAIAIAAGSDHSIALLANNQVIVWGSDNSSQLQLPPEAQVVIGVGASGDHCVVNRRRGLKVSSTLIANKKVNLVVVSTDATPIDSVRAARVRVYATSNPGLPLESWTPLLPPTLVNGSLRFSENFTFAIKTRYFRLVEQQ